MRSVRASNESVPSLLGSTSDAQPQPTPRLEIGSLAAIAVLSVVDLFADAAGTSALHVAVELAATALAVATAVRLWRRWLLTRRAMRGPSTIAFYQRLGFDASPLDPMILMVTLAD